MPHRWETPTYHSPAERSPEQDLPSDAVLLIPVAGGALEVVILPTGLKIRQISGSNHRHIAIQALTGNTFLLTLAKEDA